MSRTPFSYKFTFRYLLSVNKKVFCTRPPPLPGLTKRDQPRFRSAYSFQIESLSKCLESLQNRAAELDLILDLDPQDRQTTRKEQVANIVFNIQLVVNQLEDMDKFYSYIVKYE